MLVIIQVYECNRTQWRTDDATPILVSEGLMSAVYLLIFIRTLEKMYIDRTFGGLFFILKYIIDSRQVIPRKNLS